MTSDSRLIPVAPGAGARPAEASSDALRRQALEVARMFESTLLAQLLRQMRTPVAGDAEDQILGAGGPLGDTLDVELAQALSRAGGFGLSDAIRGALERELGSRAGDVSLRPERTAVTEVESRALPSSSGAPRDGDQAQPGVPLPLENGISSAFGWRTDPLTKELRFHQGVDLAADHGDRVHAVAPGRVVAAGRQGGYGLTVLVEHPNGLTTRYAHLSRIETAEGAEVTAGQSVGTAGQSGRATGPHLHFEVSQAGRPIDPVAAARRFAAAFKLSSGGVDFSSGPARHGPVEGEQHED
jgi:murein DD-endopeptidase MepM/ murein hydrolase activator NlpD